MPPRAVRAVIPRAFFAAVSRTAFQIDLGARASASIRCSICPGTGARAQPAFEQRLRGVHDHLGRIEGPLAAQARALLAGAVRAVEGKRARLQLRNAGAAFRAGQLLRIQPLFAVHHRDQHQAVGQFGRRLDGGFQALLDARLHQQPVHHHFDGVIPALVERDLFVERAQHAIDAGAHEALPRQLFQVLLVFALAPAHHRRQHHDAVFRPQRQHVLQNLLGGLARNLVARRPGNAACRSRNRAGAGSRRFR